MMNDVWLNVHMMFVLWIQNLPSESDKNVTNGNCFTPVFVCSENVRSIEIFINHQLDRVGFGWNIFEYPFHAHIQIDFVNEKQKQWSFISRLFI